MALNTHEAHPEQAEPLLGAAGAAAAGSPAACAARRRVDGWCSRADGYRYKQPKSDNLAKPAPETALVSSSGCRAARDEDFASGYDPGHFRHLRSTEQIVVQRSSDRLLVCVRAVVPLCLFAVPVAS